MGFKYLFSVVLLVALSLNSAHAEDCVPVSGQENAGLRQAMGLYERGLFARAEALFNDMGEDMWAEGYAVLCAARMEKREYPTLMDAYIQKYPYSGLIPQIRFHHAGNLFDKAEYEAALTEYDKVARGQLYKYQVSEYVFKKAYCDFEAGNYDRALTRFKEVVERKKSDYTTPSEYAIAYINYSRKNFAEALPWFEKAAKDRRFNEIASYYILECRFMAKNYNDVVTDGPKMFEQVPADRKAQLARLISESYLVLGDAAQARKYYEINALEDIKKKTDSDYFYAGSVLYATQDWKGAADNFSKMQSRGDSLGQIANYEMAYSYIQLKNKVAAFLAFKDASQADYDTEMQEDAFYNYAKLAFDLNDDMEPFNSYLAKYNDRKRGDKVYTYVAMGYLYDRNYASAVEAYDKIEELDEDMRSNYMKAHYLRAKELIADGSWRAAIPCLKAAAYYSGPQEGFNQLSRFWLAEAYFRDGQYALAINTLKALYNISALYGREEYDLISYNMAYCHFRQNDYPAAIKWFGDYLATDSQLCRKEALTRMGDAYFMQRNYHSALENYSKVVDKYFNVNEIYPYYQAGLSYGLLGRNAEKIEVLQPVEYAEPDAAFYSEAMFELGRAYAVASDDESAVACFTRLTENPKDSSYMAMSLIELGTLARNRSKTDDALSHYKRVVESMPMSEYADDALAAIEAIYQSRNNPQGYIDYIENIGKASVKTDAEKEAMIFNAAEQTALSGNYEKALLALQAYMEQYPQAAYKDKAEFYMGESYRHLGQKERACDHYAVVMQIGQGSFLELAILHYADLTYQLQQFAESYAAYTGLMDKALIESNKYVALLGRMRSAYNGKLYEQALTAVSAVLEHKSADEAIKLEAAYIRAKSNMSLSRRDEAMPVFAELAKDPTNVYGAEAAYLLISDLYDRGEFKEVENKVYAFADSGSPYQYWLAKSFVVLGDAFAEQGEYEQAKATFESVIEGYRPEEEDDVKDNIDLRLKKLDELIAEQNQ